jgi:hypothetical protein
MNTPRAILTGVLLQLPQGERFTCCQPPNRSSAGGGFAIASTAAGRALIAMRLDQATGAISPCDGECSAAFPRCPAWVR